MNQMLTDYNDAMSLWALHTNAELHGGMVNMSGVGPTLRGQCAAYLRDLADRIQNPTLVHDYQQKGRTNE